MNFCAIIDLRGHEIFGGENLKSRCSFVVLCDYLHNTLWQTSIISFKKNPLFDRFTKNGLNSKNGAKSKMHANPKMD